MGSIVDHMSMKVDGTKQNAAHEERIYSDLEVSVKVASDTPSGVILRLSIATPAAASFNIITGSIKTNLPQASG